jgi:hypothetical protein
MKLLTKNTILEFWEIPSSQTWHQIEGGKKCMHKFRVDFLGVLVKETLHICFFKGFRVLGF